jgi:hypothetical protein
LAFSIVAYYLLWLRAPQKGLIFPKLPHPA